MPALRFSDKFIFVELIKYSRKNKFKRLEFLLQQAFRPGKEPTKVGTPNAQQIFS